jgi:hypothetical protein
MKPLLAFISVLCSTAALAQTPAPTYGGKPLVHVGRPAAKTASAAKSASAAKPQPTGKPESTAAKLQACLELEDGTKDQLNCYDAIYPPKPNPKAAAAKGVADCHFKKEEDERDACYNDFAGRIPKLPKS